MPDNTLFFQTITQIAKLIESKEISPVELTKDMLSRIENLDGRLKSYATVMADHAIGAAKAAEAEINTGTYRGLLHGVPIAVKDLCFTKGVPTMGGTKVLADHIPTFDATVIKKLEAAGAVILGKLNLTEGAMGGYNPDFQIPVNPWDPGRWAGSSSSGSGVATAAGLCFGSLGSDTGGSIRYPSAACGTVGLKPTWGRVSRFGVLDLAESLDHVGPLTRSSVDAGIMLQAIAGLDPNDPTSLPSPVPDMLLDIDKGIKGVRIGFDEDFACKDVDPEIAAAVTASVEVLKGLGAEIVEVEVGDLDPYLCAWTPICSAEAVAAHRANYPERRDEYGPWFQFWLDTGAKVTGADYAEANNLRAACTGLLRTVFEQIDLLACPTLVDLPRLVTPEEGYTVPPVLDRDFDRYHRFTVPFDYSGLPTLDLPCGASREGLPLSLQFAGRYLSEPLLCRVGAAYEAATEWHKRHPDC